MSILDFLKRVFVEGHNPFTQGLEVNRLRPPGALDEQRFMALCIRCNRCLEVCPYGSIRRAGLGPTIGTPFVLPEAKACYLCMACCRLCPTGALDTSLRKPRNVKMGKAKIDSSICYSRLYLKHDVLPADAGGKIGALCNTCYNVCPLPDLAIRLESNLYPVVLDGCVGCGICVERCPVRPRRAINITPTGMERKDEAGFYFRKAKERHDRPTPGPTDRDTGALKGRELLEEKSRIDASDGTPDFSFPYETPKDLEDWE